MSYYDSDLVGYYDTYGNFRPWMTPNYGYLSRSSERINNDLLYGKRIYIYRDYPTTSSYTSDVYRPSYSPTLSLRRARSYSGLYDNSSLYGYSYPPFGGQKVDIYDDTVYRRYY